MKKILIFSTAYYPFVGGAEVAIKEITDRIPGIGFDLITAKMKKDLPFREKVGNVTVYRLGVGIPLLDKLIVALEGWFFARHLEKKNKYDAYWCMMASFASGTAYIKNIISNKKVPIILTLQEGDSEGYFARKWFGLINLSWKLALQRTSVLTVISNYLGDRARKLGYEGEVKLIPNGVDVQKFSVGISEEERMERRKGWGFGEDDIILVTSSRLTLKNGIGDVIEALKKLPENVKLVICGVGELEGNLKSQISNLKLEPRVKMLGFVEHSVLNKYLKSADIFIRPSLSEGMGNSFIEAMAAGIPVIATPVGGIVDFLADPTKLGQSGAELQTGYFCEPENPESIAITIMRSISDSDKNKVIENAKSLVSEKYNWRHIAVQMGVVFDSITS